jgi:SAM-dependent methyltransferase
MAGKHGHPGKSHGGHGHSGNHGAEAAPDQPQTVWPANDDWAGWATTWEARMQAFFARRQECIVAILDLLAELLPAGPARILDVGAGTGSLAGPILARFPEATVVALDLDPVLMAIGRGALGDAGGRLSWRQVNLRADGWPSQLASDGPFDAVVSIATLHHFSSRELGGIYTALAELIRPEGILVNAEGLAAGRLDAPLTQRFNEVRRRGMVPADGFWEAIAANPALAEVVTEREALRGQMHGAGPRLSAEAHLRALRRAGFQDAAVGWRSFDEAAVVGLR